MSLSDYWKGPAPRQRADDLEAQLTDLQTQYAQLEALTTKIGAMDVWEVQKLIEEEKEKEKEKERLTAIRQENQRADREVAALAQRSSDLQGQILVWERRYCWKASRSMNPSSS
ncbi:hypothetical protein [Pseudomonas fluorescens]|uniref:hypothetical protein n=1 Tax=Pseudomonas fluorescens TaxID=294 RepID=UPI002034C792|nr:hypothetical protein [Pseudomonas fluorescens]